MRKRASKLTVIGTAIGLVLAGAAMAPANAAPVPSALTATSCSAFKGATATGSPVGFSGVALKAGDIIYATASPANSTDTISANGSLGLNVILGGGPASGATFKAPVDGYYNLTFSLKTTLTSTPTWLFDATCSTSTISPTPTTPTKPGKGKNR